jgi:hypothetical protein
MGLTEATAEETWEGQEDMDVAARLMHSMRLVKLLAFHDMVASLKRDY